MAIRAALFIGLLAVACSALAQTYPDKPIRLIVPFPPGGSTDPVGRIVATKLGQRLGQNVVVENLPGGGATIGMAAVARAAPDGYTLGIGPTGALSVSVSLNPRLSYDPARDFTPISMLAVIPFVVLGSKSVPVRTAGEFVALAKAKPGSLQIGHGGNGTSMHLSAALLTQMASIDAVAVPYKGNGPVVVDLLGGQISAGIVDLPAAIAHIRAGRLEALAVTSAKRVPALPDVPTLGESAVPGYESVGWFGVIAPAGIPGPIVERLNAEIAAIINDPDTQEQLRHAGAEPVSSTPAKFADLIRSDIPKWAQVIKAAGIRAE